MTKRRTEGIILLTAMLTAVSGTVVSAGSQGLGESEALEYLGKQLEAPSNHLLETGEDVDDIYSMLTWTSVADTFPEKFDLRERGTVTPVKDQSPWGTC